MKESLEYQKLRQLSARVGADPLLVQAAGGNTSIKHDSILWIKASGTWLKNAVSSPIMVPVKLEPLLRALEDNDPAAERAQSFVISESNPGGLRPSIETTVHAVLPQKVVVHVHCVNTIAIAVQTDAEKILQQKLAGFNWLYVPYVRPGLPLSVAIRNGLQGNNSKQPIDVVVLGNHGLVVAAESTDATEKLLGQVCAALQSDIRPARDPDTAALAQLARDSNYRLPDTRHAHASASDATSLAIARGGSLYPDHVIFLGAGSVVANDGETAYDVYQRTQRDGQPEPVSILFPGAGVLMKHDADAGVEALARCLADVTSRIPANGDINYLTDNQNHELLNWDAEQYRQAMNKASRE